jgi:hypothetical protein
MGGEAFSDVRPAWQTESIMDEWAHYAQSQMSKSQKMLFVSILSIFS